MPLFGLLVVDPARASDRSDVYAREFRTAGPCTGILFGSVVAWFGRRCLDGVDVLVFGWVAVVIAGWMVISDAAAPGVSFSSLVANKEV